MEKEKELEFVLRHTLNVDPMVEAYIKIFHLVWLHDKVIQRAVKDESKVCKALKRIHADYLNEVAALQEPDKNYSDIVNICAEKILSDERETYSFDAFMTDTAKLYNLWLFNWLAPSRSVVLTLIKSCLTYVCVLIMPGFFWGGVISTAESLSTSKYEMMKEVRKKISESIRIVENPE